MISLTIPGPPVGKGRPRFARHGNFVRTYTPAKTASYESLVKSVAWGLVVTPDFYHSSKLVRIKAFFPIPKSMKKSDKKIAADELLPHTKKPDADNIAKIICDAMNRIVYADDSQIYHLQVSKWYSTNPRVEINIDI